MKLADISGLTKPTSCAPIIKRANDYLKTMRDLGKPVRSVSILPKHYDAIMRSVNAGRDKHDEYDGLRIGEGVDVLRGGS